MIDASPLFVSPAASMREVVSCIDRNRIGIALVVDEHRRLRGTITDGDVRRALLGGHQLDTTTAQQLLEGKPDAAPRAPVTAPSSSSAADLLALMDREDLRHVPLVDEGGRVVGIEVLSNLVHEYRLPLRALVMAGGLGTRLRPLTEDRPKAMLPVGERPLLELIVDQLQQSGIRRVHLATHYKAEMIEQHFGDGQRFGVDISYITEQEPLGTAGALAQLEDDDEPVLVMNGDILSDIHIPSMLDYHRAHDAALTVAVRPYEIQVPYGVLRTSGTEVTGIDEKPVLAPLVNAGIYLLQPAVLQLVPQGQRFDMPQLIEAALARRLKVISFPLREYWIDIGQAEDYRRALVSYPTVPRDR